MPLDHSKSKKAFKKNVEAEMHSGKPQRQALAIAYSLKGEKKQSEPHHRQPPHPKHGPKDYSLKKQENC